LLEWAEAFFRLSRPQDGGGSVRDHLEQVASQGIDVPELDMPDPPRELFYIVQWFEELSEGRQYSMSGPQPISWSDIMAWRECFLTHPHRWELRIIRDLDNRFIRIMTEK